jgi:cobalt/nickel transport system permease protein
MTSVCCAAELAWSGAAPWNRVMPAMAGIHAVIGVGEGLITALVLAAIARVRPELTEQEYSPLAQVLALGLIVALGLALFVAPLACKWPDGLETVLK